MASQRNKVFETFFNTFQHLAWRRGGNIISPGAILLYSTLRVLSLTVTYFPQKMLQSVLFWILS